MDEVTDTPIPEIELETEDVLDLEMFDPAEQAELEWKMRTGLTEETLVAAIEAVIFMSDRPLSIEKIRKSIDAEMPLRLVFDSVKQLQEKFEDRSHGIRLAEVAEGYQFRTKLGYANFIENVHKSASFTLSPTALEVLALIAYRQPISRTEIDRMRGVDSSHIVRALMDKRLVTVAGRSEELGRPTTYKTTPDFLEFFNLSNLSELPDESELVELTKNNVGEISDIHEIVNGDVKDKFTFDDIDELDNLSHSIKQIQTDTAFTKSLKVKPQEGKVTPGPFEIIESFLVEDEILKANQSAASSEVFTAIHQVDVIKDLREGPFNEPEEMEEEIFEEPEELYEVDEFEQEREELQAKFQEVQAEIDDLELEDTEDDFEREMEEALQNIEQRVHELENNSSELTH